jgi:hypothetical protein
VERSRHSHLPPSPRRRREPCSRWRVAASRRGLLPHPGEAPAAGAPRPPLVGPAHLIGLARSALRADRRSPAAERLRSLPLQQPEPSSAVWRRALPRLARSLPPAPRRPGPPPPERPPPARPPAEHAGRHPAGPAAASRNGAVRSVRASDLRVPVARRGRAGAGASATGPIQPHPPYCHSAHPSLRVNPWSRLSVSAGHRLRSGGPRPLPRCQPLRRATTVVVAPPRLACLSALHLAMRSHAAQLRLDGDGELRPLSGRLASGSGRFSPVHRATADQRRRGVLAATLRSPAALSFHVERKGCPSPADPRGARVLRPPGADSKLPPLPLVPISARPVLPPFREHWARKAS